VPEAAQQTHRHGAASFDCGVSNTAEERFWEKVHMAPNGCWLWTHAATRAGVGVFWYAGRYLSAHRAAWMFKVGPLDGEMLGHCELHKSCVNPAHLSIIDRGEQQRRAHLARHVGTVITHCPHGHEYTPENTYLQTKRGYKVCRTCSRERLQAIKAKKREATRLKRDRAAWIASVEEHVYWSVSAQRWFVNEGHRWVRARTDTEALYAVADLVKKAGRDVLFLAPDARTVHGTQKRRVLCDMWTLEALRETAIRRHERQKKASDDEG
jgi:hypothetical protein